MQRHIAAKGRPGLRENGSEKNSTEKIRMTKEVYQALAWCLAMGRKRGGEEYYTANEMTGSNRRGKPASATVSYESGKQTIRGR